MTDRRISFEGISNARDLGGLVNRDGKMIRKGFLLRSANLSQATQADIARLRDEYHLSLVIDLRTPMAERMKPDVSIEGVDHRRLPVFDDAMIGITHESERDYVRRKTLMPRLEDLYKKMVTEPYCRDKFRQALTAIMTNEKGSSLWHCSEGKDWCGLTSVFLLCVLGVNREQILEDYMMTNEVALDRGEQYYQKVLENGGSEEVAASVRDAFIVKETYLHSALDAIEAMYPDLETYISEGLSVSQEVQKTFRERMLV